MQDPAPAESASANSAEARPLASGRYLLREGRHGLFLVNPRDRYVGRALAEYGEFSEWEVAALLATLAQWRQLTGEAPKGASPEAACLGGVVIEAGANMGAITVPLARRLGREGCLFAYEPQRLTFQQLCANLALNGLDNVVARWAACGAARGAIKVPVIDPDQPANIGGLDIRNHVDGELVDVEPIDMLGLERCDLIKADVEGMERDVLAGARETIARCRPVLYLENDRPENGAALIADVLALGYRGWWHTPPLFNERNWAQRPDDVWLAEEGKRFVSINMLCVPAESKLDAKGLRPLVAGEDHRQLVRAA